MLKRFTKYRKEYQNFRTGNPKGCKGEIDDIINRFLDFDFQKELIISEKKIIKDNFDRLDPISNDIKDKIKFTFCLICFTHVNLNSWVTLECGHNICMDCVLKMLSNTLCPYCRSFIIISKILPKHVRNNPERNQNLITAAYRFDVSNYRNYYYNNISTRRIGNTQVLPFPDGYATPDSQEEDLEAEIIEENNHIIYNNNLNGDDEENNCINSYELSDILQFSFLILFLSIVFLILFLLIK